MDFSAWYMELREWLILHPDAILLSIFLVSLIEAVAVVGVVIPAVPMLFVLCVLAAHADVHLLHLFIAGIAGAMIGDGISYSFGHGFKHRIENFWPFNRYPNWLQRAESFVEQHGGKGIILGRFIGPLRAFVPMAAGIFHMRPFYFIWMNFLSALVWAPFHLLPGYSLGAAAAHNWLPGRSQLIFIAIILIIAAILTWLLPALDTWRHRRAERSPLANHGKWFSFDEHPEDQRASLWLAFCAMMGTLLIVASRHLFPHWDTSLSLELFALRQTMLDIPLISLIMLTEKAALLIFGSIMLGWLLLRKEWHAVGILLLATIACFTIPPLLKILFSVPRPDLVIARPATWSFPSGLAFNAVVVWGLLLIFIDRIGPEKLCNVMRPVLLTLMLFGITASPVIGIHWPSDAFAGAFLGLACLALLRWFWFRFDAPKLNPIEAMTVIVIALCLTVGLEIYPYYADTLAGLQINIPPFETLNDPFNVE